LPQVLSQRGIILLFCREGVSIQSDRLIIHPGPQPQVMLPGESDPARIGYSKLGFPKGTVSIMQQIERYRIFAHQGRILLSCQFPKIKFRTEEVGLWSTVYS